MFSIEPFTTIAADVEIGEGTWIGCNVTIMDGARIGKTVNFSPNGNFCNSTRFEIWWEQTLTIIGDNTTIRECVTINRGTKALGYTKVGMIALSWLLLTLLTIVF